LVFSVIPWDKYKEVEIQEITANCFRNANFEVKNIHKSDPAGEKGVDILATKDDCVIAIAIKTKPKGVDRSQLQDLAEYPADRRIYIYTITPTHSFIEFMERELVKSSVEFWSHESLGGELFKLDSSFMSSLALSYSPACFECNLIVGLLAPLWRNSTKVNVEEHIAITESIDISFKPEMILWELKDHSSSLHKMAMALQQLFENMSKTALDTTQQLLLLSNCLDMLVMVRKEIIHRLHSDLKEVLENWYDKILRVASATRLRTNWLHIFNFRNITTAFYSERVLESFSELKDSEENWQSFLSEHENQKVSLMGVEYYNEFKENISKGICGIEWFFGALKQFAWGVEEIVNDLYISLSDKDFDRHHSDWGSYPSLGVGFDYDEIAGLPGMNKHELIRPYMLDHLVERDDVARSTKELIKIRWHIVTNCKKFECPKCQSPLIFSSSGREILLKCENKDCKYQFH
jgi:hypothetical protein